MIKLSETKKITRILLSVVMILLLAAGTLGCGGTTVGDDDEGEDAAKDIYLNSVKPWYDEVVEEYDSSWAQLWQTALVGIGDGTVSVEQAKDMLNELSDSRLYNLTDKVNGYDIPDGLGEEEQAALEVFKENMVLAVDVRTNATTEMLLVLDGMLELDEEMIEETISRGDAYMIKAAASMAEMQSNLGVLE